jgi:putative ABC transport system ATP-binding protein
MDGPIVQARRLRKVYHGAEEVEALRDIDLTIERGEMIAIVGPSGSGKTTLLNCLSGLDVIDGGQVVVAGQDLSTMSDGALTAYRSKAMGFVFQTFNLLPVLSALENVEIPLLLQGMAARESRRRALDMLEELGLGNRANHRPDQLSGGEQQLVALARALIHKPAVVWADEPTGMLDSEVTGVIVDLLVRTNKSGQTIVLVTHNPQVSERAQRTVYMRDGCIEATTQPSIDQLRQQAVELQASRARLVAAADDERRRIERNLHDGAQQRLVAIAIKARLIEQVASKDPERAQQLLNQLPQDATAALDELRALAQGIYPPLLSSAGLGEALSAESRRAPISATVDVDGVGRFPRDVESAIYFCCLEALQNAGKHAGDGASARVHLWKEHRELLFEVADDGGGFDVAQTASGSGLTNMRDRLAAVGGTISVHSAIGTGTRVRGVVPLPESGE